MIVIFDANAFYSYFGEDKLGTVGGIPNVDRDKLKKELEKEKKVYSIKCIYRNIS